MNRTALTYAAAVTALLTASSAHAAGALVPSDLDGVVVTANRAPQRIDKVGGQITLIGPDAIRRDQTVAVADLLSQTPGVTVTRNGGIGGAAQLRIRGAESDQTVVLIDGVKLNDPSSTGGGYNFGNLLVGDIDRIEVLRGAQSVLWGSQAIGGVVNIITAAPTGAFEGSAQAEYGSHNSSFLRAGVGGANDRLVWRLAASQYQTDGVSAFSKSRGGRERDGYRNTGAAGKAKVLITDQLSLDLRAVYSRGRTEFDGFPAPLFTFADTNEYGTTEDFVGYAGVNLDLFGGRFKNRLGYAYTDTDRVNYNPAQAVTNRTFAAQGKNRRWEYQGTVAVNDAWSVVFGAEDEKSDFVSASPSAFAPNPVPARADVNLTGVYAQVTGEVLPGVTIAAGLRRDDHDTFGDSTVGQASVAWALNDGSTVLRASWGQGFKAPTLYQLYSEYGNTALGAEESESWDAGVQQKLLDGQLVLQAAYFSRESSNQIDFFSCTFGSTTGLCRSPVTGLSRFGYYANTVKTQAHGVELQGQAKIGERLTLSANYTYTQTENQSPGANRGKDLARRPEHAANAQAGYLWPVGLQTDVVVRHLGDSFDNVGNTVLNKGYTLIDLKASYPLNERLEVYGRVENLGDERYETIRNYGQLGRTGAIGLRARF